MFVVAITVLLISIISKIISVSSKGDVRYISNEFAIGFGIFSLMLFVIWILLLSIKM